MIPHGSNLLVAAAIDFGGDDWPAVSAERMASSFALGKGGKVLHQRQGQCLLLTRPRAEASPSAIGRIDGQETAVLFAGHLYDRADLRQRLALPASQPMSDSDLYAAAYARWGDACDEKVNGHYAAIIWSGEQGILRAARSPVDPSPLHWWSDGRRLIVATTPRAIFAAGIPRSLDEVRLDTALAGQFKDPTRSWFNGVSRIEGGTIMTWHRGGCSRRQFWSLESQPEIRFKRDEDYVDALDSLFAKATAETLEGVQKPGLLLSGGLDSQAVATYALDTLGADTSLDCFTSVPAAGFRPVARVDSFPDERDHVAALAKMHPQLRVNYIEAEGLDFTHLLPEMFLLASALPLAALNLHWLHASLERAAAAGCDVILTGASGNAGFSYGGETAYAGWLRQGRLIRLWRELRNLDRNRSMLRHLISMAIMPNVPPRFAKKIGSARGQSELPGCPLRDDHVSRHRLHSPPLRPRTPREARARLLALGASEGGDIELGLELLHGVQLRDPTAYRPLIEFCAGLPDDQYLRDGTSRWLARRLLAGRIPDQVRLDRRIGQQASDWPLRLERRRADFLAELHSLGEDSTLTERFDIERTTAALKEWDGLDSRGSRVYENVALATSRTIVANRFIRFVNGSNQ